MCTPGTRLGRGAGTFCGNLLQLFEEDAARLLAPFSARQTSVTLNEDFRVDVLENALKGRSSVLSPASIEAWKNAPQHLVLAACSSRSGPLRRGGDGRNLIGATLLAGADGVSLSARRVRFDHALTWVERYLEAQATEGLSPTRALRNARVAALAEGDTAEDRIAPLLLHAVGLGDRPLLDVSEMPGAASHVQQASGGPCSCP